MKTLLSTLFVIAAAANMAMAADKPDFSGDWKMDADKSTFGPIPAPTSMTRKIEHKEPSLTVATVAASPAGDQNTTAKYMTDGTETTNSMMGSDIKSKARWDGKTLLIDSAGNFGGADIKVGNKWSLSDDGKVLTDVMSISTPQGDFELTYVLNKQ